MIKVAKPPNISQMMGSKNPRRCNMSAVLHTCCVINFGKFIHNIIKSENQCSLTFFVFFFLWFFAFFLFFLSFYYYSSCAYVCHPWVEIFYH